MSTPLNPRDALFQGTPSAPIIASCEHYAGSEKLILKAFALQQEFSGAFDVTCDCEDGALAGAEKQHAEMLAQLLQARKLGSGSVGIRIHDPLSAFWRMELETILSAAGKSIAYITVPKARSAADLHPIRDAIAELSQRYKLPKSITIHVLIETPIALQQVWEIAAMPDVSVLDFGLLDFISEHGGAISSESMKSPAQFTHKLIVRAKTEIAAAALGNGKIPSHNITLQFRDTEQVFNDARRARDEFGFMRMWSIHPAQIQPILDAMSPSFAEVTRAEAILLKGHAAAWAPIAYEEQLHDRASYRYFWTILERARFAKKPIGEEALNTFGL